MPLLELPHTASCLVCGTANPHGLRLSLFVDPADGSVTTTFTPADHHVGFPHTLHGGILMTVADEAMAWAAIFASKRLCLAAEFTSRFQSPARPRDPLTIRATITTHRPRLLTAHCTITSTTTNTPISQSTAKFIPLPPDQYPTLTNALLPHPSTAAATDLLRPSHV